jgi:hypothetical protein
MHRTSRRSSQSNYDHRTQMSSIFSANDSLFDSKVLLPYKFLNKLFTLHLDDRNVPPACPL